MKVRSDEEYSSEEEPEPASAVPAAYYGAHVDGRVPPQPQRGASPAAARCEAARQV